MSQTDSSVIAHASTKEPAGSINRIGDELSSTSSSSSSSSSGDDLPIISHASSKNEKSLYQQQYNTTTKESDDNDDGTFVTEYSRSYCETWFPAWARLPAQTKKIVRIVMIYFFPLLLIGIILPILMTADPYSPPTTTPNND